MFVIVINTSDTMNTIPRITKALQKAHTGESAAIIDGKIVAFGKDSLEAEKKAIVKGYKSEDIMTTYIMGTQYYAM